MHLHLLLLCTLSLFFSGALSAQKLTRADEFIVSINTPNGKSDFDRLVELGVVKELTGRPTFRLYGMAP